MDQSHFRELSAQLRNEIHDRCSYTPDGGYIELQYLRGGGYRWHLKSNTCRPHTLALTAVCREIRREARGAFLAVNNVSLIVPMLEHYMPGCNPETRYFTTKIQPWMTKMGDIERMSLKIIELDIDMWMIDFKYDFVDEAELARSLYDISETLNEARVQSRVWFCIKDMHSDRRGRSKPLIVSFDLAPVEVACVEVLAKFGKVQEEIDRIYAGYWTRTSLTRLELGQRRLMGLHYELQRIVDLAELNEWKAKLLANLDDGPLVQTAELPLTPSDTQQAEHGF